MTSKKPRILIRTDDATKAALEALAAEQERSVSFILNKIAIAWLQENGRLAKPKREKK